MLVAGMISMLLLACSGTAFASPISFSVFAGLNRAGDIDNVFIGGRDSFTEPPPTLDPDGSYSGGKARFGAAMLYDGWVGLEVGWSRLASEDRFNSHFIEFVCPGSCPTGEGVIIDTVEQRATAMWAAFVPTLRRGQWEVYGKVGTSRTENESRQRTDRSNRIRITDTGLMVGAGAAYYSAVGIGLRVDIDRLGDTATQVGASIAFRF